MGGDVLELQQVERIVDAKSALCCISLCYSTWYHITLQQYCSISTTLVVGTVCIYTACLVIWSVITRVVYLLYTLLLLIIHLCHVSLCCSS